MIWEEVDGTSVLHHWQQYQNVCFLMRNVLQQHYEYYFHMVHQSISCFKHVFFSFYSIIFGYQLDFYLLRQFVSWIFWQLPFCFWVSRYFLPIYRWCKGNRVNLKCMFTKILTMFMTHTWKNKGQKGEYRDSLRMSHEQPSFSNHRK